MRIANSVLFVSLATLFAFQLAHPASAEMLSYKADLKGASEVPPNETKGTGSLDATFDTASKKLSWTVTYSGLTGDAIAGHFHGPAAPTANAPVTVPFSGSLVSPIKGEATLTDAQAADLEANRLYVNIHTNEHKGGELRGQVMKK
ncbi:MAG: CHRD domain-containing protein [Xanthobacteraceae bacterium]|nr:MAG: CHRD domain-containing protein [Xanthobacteraceae bacterium]